MPHSAQMDRDFLIYASSIDSSALFTTNDGSDFTVQLSKDIHLEGKWSCALTEFQLYASTPKPVHVCCDIVVDSYTGDSKLPTLRRIRLKTNQFDNLQYIPLKVNHFNTIRIYIITPSGRIQSPGSGVTYCTLHFRHDT